MEGQSVTTRTLLILSSILPILWGGCAMTTTLDGKLLQGFGTDGTSELGEVTYILSREEMEKGLGDRQGVRIPPIYQELLNKGVSDEELIDGKVVVIVYQTYWHNRSRRHDFLDWAIVEKGSTLKKGNVVKVEAHQPYPIVTGIIYSEMKDGDCQLITGDRGGVAALDLINPVGGPGTANLYCPKLEQEGWQKTPFGMYTGGFLMTKPPKT